MGARRAAKAAIEADYESDFGDDGFVSGEGSVGIWMSTDGDCSNCSKLFNHQRLNTP
jgi:hypothetical protein